jgi:hypothetical protein
MIEGTSESYDLPIVQFEDPKKQDVHCWIETFKYAVKEACWTEGTALRILSISLPNDLKPPILETTNLKAAFKKIIHHYYPERDINIYIRELTRLK